MRRELFFLFILLSFFYSCNTNGKNSSNKIDLESGTNILKYSNFVDSLSYLYLNTNDSCLISGIKKIYIDEDTLIVIDNRREGVFVFTSKGDFIKQIHAIGQGPTEYHSESSVAVDTENNVISIYSAMDQKMIRYTCSGDFIDSQKLHDFIRDHEFIDNYTVMINPTKSLIVEEKSGVWLTDIYNTYKKHLITNAPDHEFTYISRHSIKTNKELFYYDTNLDYIYSLNSDSAKLLYSLNIVQKIPDKKRVSANISLKKLEGYSMMNNFCTSTNYILINYYIFKESSYNNFRWIFLNKEDDSVIVYKDFIDDIDHTESDQQDDIFYINDSTWCRVITTTDFNCNTVLQFLHLK